MRDQRLLKVFRSRYFSITATLVLVSGLAALIGALSHQWIHARNQARFQLIAQDRLMILNRAIERNLEVIHSIRGLFAANDNVTREEFRRGVENALKRHPEVQALEWMVRVPDSLRAQFEKSLEKEGFKGHAITEMNEREQRVVAPVRSEYFVIYYAEPLSDNREVIGYNPWGSSAARQALRVALKGEIGISPWMTLGQGEIGFVVYMPLEVSWAPAGKIKPAPKGPRTFAVGVFRIKRLFEVALKGAMAKDVNFLVSDVEPGVPPSKFYRYDSNREELTEAKREDWEAAEQLKMHWTSAIHLDGRAWAIRFFPSTRLRPAYSDALPVFLALVVMVVGVLVTLFGSSLRQTRIVTRLLAQESEARETAEAALKTRDEFLAIASHELRTPLTPLRMQLSLVRKMTTDQISDTPAAKVLLQSLAVADRQLDRLLRLIQDLLDVTRMGDGKLSIRPEEFELVDLVKKIAESFSTNFAQAGSSLRIEATPPIVGCWDRLRIEQLVINLLMNAVKFGGGKPIELHVGREAGWAVLKVKDHGIGIAEGDQKRIFGRFERAVSSNSFAGMGLGLFIVYQIVAAHQGEISVLSRPGEGATFVVKLPLTSCSAFSGTA